MHLGPVCAIGVIGEINKACGTEAFNACGTRDAIVRRAGLDEISGSMRAKRAPGEARDRTVPASRRGGNRDLKAREAHKGTERRVMTRGVGSCL